MARPFRVLNREKNLLEFRVLNRDREISPEGEAAFVILDAFALLFSRAHIIIDLVSSLWSEEDDALLLLFEQAHISSSSFRRR